MKEATRWWVAASAAAVAVFLLLEGIALAVGFEIVVVAVGLAGVRRLLGAVPEPGPEGWWWRTRGIQPARRLPLSLRRVERMVVFGPRSRWTAERRLLPALRDLAAERLAARHGLDPVAHPRQARALLGEAAWHGLRHDLDAGAPGLGELEAVVTAIEAL